MARFTTSFNVLFVSLLTMVKVSSSIPVVQAPWGTIQSVEVAGDGGRKMDSYLGIPFALPPVGDLRFEKPKPHPGPGEGKVFVADVTMPACIQSKGILVASSRDYSEDCLKLNVFVPRNSSSSLFPVMFFIHGGGLISGDATTYRPSRLVADGNVIVVIIQYRLGPFGFISTGDDRLLGNQGLWDQNLALRWVKDNIRAFGGDPDLITVFGESSGSMSAGVQMMSPHSSKLMKRVIMQSGSPEMKNMFASRFDASTAFRQIADLFQCQGQSSTELLQCLKAQEAEDFFNRTLAFEQTTPARGIFLARVDGDFIPRAMKEMVQDERYVQDNGIGDIDVISGFNNQEGALAIIIQALRGRSSESLRWSETFRAYLDLCTNWTPDEARVVVEKAVEFFYRGADSFTNSTTMSGQEVTDMYGDCLLMAPAVDWARCLAAMNHASNQYLYVLDHDFRSNARSLIHGSHHMDDLWLEFDDTLDIVGTSVFINKRPLLADDEQPLADKFVQMITAFARTGNPSPAVRDDLGGDWPQFTTENEAYLSVSMSPRVQENLGPFRDRTALWTKLVPELEASARKDATTSGTGADKAPMTGKDEL